MREASGPGIIPALGRISSGLYICTTGIGRLATGFLASWVQQAGFEPPAVTVAIQQDRDVNALLRDCEHFCLSVIAPSSTALIKHFARGFDPGADPFVGVATALSASGVPYLTAAHAHLECRRLGEERWSDHVIHCGEVLAGSCVRLDETPFQHVRKNGLSY